MYAKLFTSIYQGTLRGNSHGLLVFTNLLAHADSAGVVDVHPRAISEEVGLTVEQVKAAIAVLEAPDEESRSPDEEGRRLMRLDEHRAWGWRIVNYLKYRAIRNEEDRREQNRAAQKRWRSKQLATDQPSVSEPKQSKPRKPPSAQAEAEAEAKAASSPKRKERDAPAALLGLDGVDPQHLADWKRVRRDKRLASLTQSTVSQFLAQVAKTKLTVPEAVALCAAEGWGGFKASWVGEDGRTPRDRYASAPATLVAAKTAQRAEWAADAKRLFGARNTLPPEVIDGTTRLID